MKRSYLGKIVMAAAAVTLAMGMYIPAEAGSANGAAQKLESAKQTYVASIRAEALRTGSEIPEHINAGSPSQWLTRVDASKINMVTDRVSGESTTKVNINGSSYFVGGETYAWTLEQNQSLRFSTDPITGKKVNKATAATFADADGNVLYFENEGSLKSFLALGAPSTDTVFGYSEPR